MKKLLITCLILFCPSFISANIVSDGIGSEDSISVSISLLDSLGNPSDLAADSFYISVIGPGGDSAITMAGVAGSTGLHIDSLEQTLIGRKYLFSEGVSELIGAGSYGVYELTFCAKSISPLFINCRTIYFQYVKRPLSEVWAMIEATLDSLRAQDDWVAKEASIPFIDSSFIARSVWNSPQSNHNISGTFGDYLDAEITGLGTGSGLYAYTVTVIDSSTGQILPGVRVVVRNLAQTALIGVGQSDINGLATFNLNDGEYLLLTEATGYRFDSFDSVTINGSVVDTLYGYPFDPGAPVAAGLCRVYGYLYDINGLPEELAEVTVSLPSGAALYGPRIISPFSVSTTTDTTGYFYIDIIPSDSLETEYRLYDISISRKDGTILRKRLSVPAQSSWQLSW